MRITNRYLRSRGETNLAFSPIESRSAQRGFMGFHQSQFHNPVHGDNLIGAKESVRIDFGKAKRPGLRQPIVRLGRVPKAEHVQLQNITKQNTYGQDYLLLLKL